MQAAEVLLVIAEISVALGKSRDRKVGTPIEKSRDTHRFS